MSDILEIVIAGFAAIISLIAWWSSYSSNKYNLESTVFGLIQTAKANLDQNLLHINEDDDFEPLIEDYLTALNYACSLYKDNKINKTRFRLLYKQDILNIFNVESFISVVQKNNNAFSSLYSVWNEFIEKQNKN